jgi:gamma-glutamyl-gamma-aminobutyrate hydrolase PuuD
MAEKKVTVYSAGFGGYGPLAPIADSCRSIMEPASLEKKDDEFAILLLHGGEDISPTIYNAEKHPLGNGSETLSYRDERETTLVRRAIELGIPIFGICRGAQLLCAMAGGDLFQHVHGHSGNHKIITKYGQTLTTTSIHHQMMNPFILPEDEYELLAWAEKPLSNIYHHHKGDFKTIHPEMMPITDDFVNWCRSEFFKRTV